MDHEGNQRGRQRGEKERKEVKYHDFLFFFCRGNTQTHTNMHLYIHAIAHTSDFETETEERPE